MGDFQPRGRIGVLLYSRMYCFNCLCRSSFAYKKAAVSGGLLLQGFGVANDDVGEPVAAHKKGTAFKPFLCGAANRI